MAYDMLACCSIVQACIDYWRMLLRCIHHNASYLDDAIQLKCWISCEHSLLRHDGQGRTTLSNVSDPVTNMWRQDNSINYTSYLYPGQFEYEFGFSSVSCVTVTFDSNCHSDAMTWYLVEINRLLSNFDYPAYSNPRVGVSSGVQGFVNNSLCVGSCTNKHIAVDPKLGYYVMVGNAESSSGYGDECTYQFTMTTDADTSGQSGV